MTLRRPSEDRRGMGTDDAAGWILVGIDGSADGLRAVLYAMREARVSGASLRLVHVVDETRMAAGLWELVADSRDLKRTGLGHLREAEDLLSSEGFPSERVSSEVILGDPARELSLLSADARLAVVGRRAMSGLERMFVGSTSVAMAAQARCPVIVISAASTPHETGRLHVVAVVVNAWPPRDGCLEWAVREAGARQARLRVLRLVPQPLESASGVVSAAMIELDNHLSALREEQREVPIETEVVAGNPIDEVVAASRVVDLVILDVTSEPAALSGLTRGVMAHAYCPVGLWK